MNIFLLLLLLTVELDMEKEAGFEGSFAYIWDQIRYIAVHSVQSVSKYVAPALAAVREQQGFRGYVRAATLPSRIAH